MYSGVSSVPRISSGSRSRLEKTRRGKHEIANESKKQITHSWMVRFFGGMLSSSMGCFPMSAMALGFSPLSKGKKMWSDGGVCEWICRASQRAILLNESALGVMTGWRTLLGYQKAGFSVDFAPRGSCIHVFGSSKVPEFVWKR
jgi:hypothetical protein